MEYVIDINKQETFSMLMKHLTDEEIKKTLVRNPFFTEKHIWFHYLNLTENLKEGSKIVFTQESGNYSRSKTYTFRNWHVKGYPYKPSAYFQLKELYDIDSAHTIEISDIEMYDKDIHGYLEEANLLNEIFIEYLKGKNKS